MLNNLSNINPILRKPALKVATGKSDSATYLDIKAGLFTPSVSLGPRSVGWPLHKVEAIMAARIAGKSENDIKALVSSLVAARKRAS